MINATNKRVIVRVDMEQKGFTLIGGVKMQMALKFEQNYREKSPVIATVVSGNNYLKEGDIIVTHHNHYLPPSPYQLEEDLFSIPFNKTIFAKVSKSGNLTAICGNVLGNRIPIETKFELPSEMQKTYIDRLIIADKGWSSFKNGTTVLHKPNAGYDIVYNWNGIEKRVTKVDCEQICGILIPSK